MLPLVTGNVANVPTAADQTQGSQSQKIEGSHSLVTRVNNFKKNQDYISIQMLDRTQQIQMPNSVVTSVTPLNHSDPSQATPPDRNSSLDYISVQMVN